MENCGLSITADQTEANSTIIGVHTDIIYKVNYQIILNKNWETMYVKIDAGLNDTMKNIIFKSDGQVTG
ncbi:MAG: hypothetical protein WKI04_19075 [Ferruginibacter sp.]